MELSPVKSRQCHPCWAWLFRMKPPIRKLVPLWCFSYQLAESDLLLSLRFFTGHRVGFFVDCHRSPFALFLVRSLRAQPIVVLALVATFPFMLLTYTHTYRILFIHFFCNAYSISFDTRIDVNIYSRICAGCT